MSEYSEYVGRFTMIVSWESNYDWTGRVSIWPSPPTNNEWWKHDSEKTEWTVNKHSDFYSPSGKRFGSKAFLNKYRNVVFSAEVVRWSSNLETYPKVDLRNIKKEVKLTKELNQIRAAKAAEKAREKAELEAEIMTRLDSGEYMILERDRRSKSLEEFEACPSYLEDTWWATAGYGEEGECIYYRETVRFLIKEVDYERVIAKFPKYKGKESW